MGRGRRILVAAGILAVAATAFSATAVDVDSVIRARKANFTALLAAFKASRDELRRPDANPAVVETSAEREIQLARQIPTWFPSGTGPAFLRPTYARDNIWATPNDFRAKAGALAAAAGKLDEAARARDLQAMRAAQFRVADACDSCHRVYVNGP